MANIGQFKAGTEWKKLDEVTGYTFEADSSYTIQNKEYQPLLICEGADAPTGDNVGFIIKTNESFGYTAKSGEFCWVRAYRNVAQFNVAEGI